MALHMTLDYDEEIKRHQEENESLRAKLEENSRTQSQAPPPVEKEVDQLASFSQSSFPVNKNDTVIKATSYNSLHAELGERFGSRNGVLRPLKKEAERQGNIGHNSFWFYENSDLLKASEYDEHPLDFGEEPVLKKDNLRSLRKEAERCQGTTHNPVPEYREPYLVETSSLEETSSNVSSTSTLASPATAPWKYSATSEASHRPLSGGAHYRIKVETGLLGIMPKSLRISKHNSPCAVFAIVDDESGDVVWRFVKEYEQIRGFYDAVKYSLNPLIKARTVQLTQLPGKELFLKNIPWQVDVRNDMMNAVFTCVANLSSNQYFMADKIVQKRVNSILSTFWLHDIVDLALSRPPSDDEMWGFLLVQPARRSRDWSTHYCVLNGAFLDVFERYGDKSPHMSIPLAGAQIQRVIVFFDADEYNDARYVFKVFEDRKVSNKEYSFTAENDDLRERWLARLRGRITQIKSGSILPEAKFYGEGSCPPSYLLRESPHKTSHSWFGHKRAGGAASIKSSVSSVGTMGSKSNTMGLSNPCESTELLNRFSVYDTLHKNRSTSESHKSTETGDFFVGVAHPMTCQQPLQVNCVTLDRTRGAQGEEPEPRIHSRPFLTRSSTSGSTKESLERKISNPIPINDRENGHRSMFINSSMALPKSQSCNLVKGKVFGVMPSKCKHLLTLPSGEPAPSVVVRCLQRLKHTDATSELGIFRISGTQTQLDKLQNKFDTLGDYDMVKAKADVHTTADLLKRYLRSLPDSLFSEWKESKSKALLSKDDVSQQQILETELKEMEPMNRTVVSVILALLAKVSRNEAANSMGLWNLGVALSPAFHIPSPVLALYIKHEMYIK